MIGKESVVRFRWRSMARWLSLLAFLVLLPLAFAARPAAAANIIPAGPTQIMILERRPAP